MIDKYIQLNDVSILEIEDNRIHDWDYSEANIIKVTLPSSSLNCTKMYDLGFTYVDRIIDVCINLSKANQNYENLIFTKIQEESVLHNELLQIAYDNFNDDIRFNLPPSYEKEISKKLIKLEGEKSKKIFSCVNQDIYKGFISIYEKNSTTAYINLAVVDFKYRISRIAISLYAKAAIEATSLGYKYLTGTISTKNSSVINLYSYMNAQFQNPKDVFIKHNPKMSSEI